MIHKRIRLTPIQRQELYRDNHSERKKVSNPDESILYLILRQFSRFSVSADSRIFDRQRREQAILLSAVRYHPSVKERQNYRAPVKEEARRYKDYPSLLSEEKLINCFYPEKL